MNIVQETTSSQTIRIIPRNYPSTVDYKITNEETNEVITVNALVVSQSLGYLLIEGVFDFKEDNSYVLTVFNEATSETIFRGKLFCTNQDVKDYSINKDEYIFDDSYDDDIIVYDPEFNTAPKNLVTTLV